RAVTRNTSVTRRSAAVGTKEGQPGAAETTQQSKTTDATKQTTLTLKNSMYPAESEDAATAEMFAEGVGANVVAAVKWAKNFVTLDLSECMYSQLKQAHR